MRLYQFLFYLLFVGILSSAAQTNVFKEEGVFFIQNTKVRVHEHWRIDNMFQYRRVDLLDNTQLFFIRPSINYLINDNISLGVGYWFLIANSAGINGPLITRNEHRIWQQLSIKNNLSKVRLAHRFMFEQRYKGKIHIDTDPPMVSGRTYAQRLRYRILVTFNLFKLKNEKPLKFRLFEEVRVRFKAGLSDPDFDQNNLYGLLGYELIDDGMLWLGYGNDYFKINNTNYVSNNLFRIRFDYSIDLREK